MPDLHGYHALLGASGIGILLAYWLPRFFLERGPGYSFLLMLFGFATFSLVPGLPPVPDPALHPHMWELVSELCVVFALFGTGLRIDRVAVWSRSVPTLRLLAVVMPVSIALVAGSGWLIAGLTVAGSLLLGAVLAPTDPVLAGDVQVGPPLEGGEHPLRYSLTTEAGLNDGLAFPFVHLAIALVVAGQLTGQLALDWVLNDVFYRIVVGGLSGIAVGWLLGKILFDWPSSNAISETGSGVIALAGVLPAYGLTELLGGYGFIAAFLAGFTLRRYEAQHRFHRSMHDFCEAIEQASTSALLFALGAVLPVLLPALDLQTALVVLLLILLFRPVVGYLAISGTNLRLRERLVVAFYGVRGIGSIYYLAYAGSRLELGNERQLWAAIAFAILASTLIHGLTAGLAVDKAMGEAESKG